MGELENENKMLLTNVMMDSKEILNFKAELLKTNFKRNIFTFHVHVHLLVYKKNKMCYMKTHDFGCMINTGRFIK